MEGLQAHFLPLDANGICDAVGQPQRALQNAAFEPHKLPIVGHGSESQVKRGIELSAMVRSLARRSRRDRLVRELSQLFDFPFRGTGRS